MTSKLRKRGGKKAGKDAGSLSSSSGTGMPGTIGRISAKEVEQLEQQQQAFREAFSVAANSLDLSAAIRAIKLLQAPPLPTRGFQEAAVKEQLLEAERGLMEACRDFSMLCSFTQDVLHKKICFNCEASVPTNGSVPPLGPDSIAVVNRGQEEGTAAAESTEWSSGTLEHRCECKGSLKDWCFTFHCLLMEHYAPGLAEWCRKQGEILNAELEEQRGKFGSISGVFQRDPGLQLDTRSHHWTAKPLRPILPHGNDARLMVLLKHYLSRSSNYLDASGISLKMVTAFLAFVQYNGVDRHSCLVGFQPSKAVIEEAVTAKIESSGRCALGFGALILVKDTTGNLFGPRAESVPSPAGIEGISDASRKGTWLRASSGEERKLGIGKGIQPLSPRVKEIVSPLARGRRSKTEALRERCSVSAEPSTLASLSLALPEGPVSEKVPVARWLFVRSLGKVGDNRVEVLPSAAQTNTEVVEEKFCYGLPQSLQEQVKLWTEEDPAKLEQMLVNPLNHLSRTLLQLVQDLTFDYFADQGVAIEAIGRAHRSEALLGDAFELQKARSALEGITEEEKLPPVLVMGVHSEAVREVRAFFSSSGPFAVFQPTIHRDLDQLQELYSSRTVFSSCCRLRNNVESSLEQLEFKKFHLLKGNLKKELVAWWLKLISSSVKKFIAEWGFIPSAVPKNYTEAPPQDMNHVRRNIDLLAALLQPNGKYKAQMDAHIKRLQDTIYPRIDAFVRDTKAVISAELNADITSYTLEQVKDLAGTLKEEMGLQMGEWVENTIMDIVYLEEMRLLDDPEYSKGKSRLDIVPVTGLVVSVLLRLENEHKTVLDLWGHIERAGELVEDRVESLALHHAIGEGNEKLAEQLLEAGMNQPLFNLNEQDQNGWTALHCAASAQQYRLCRKLIAAGADTDIVNQDSSTALIYVVKRRPAEGSEGAVKKDRIRALKALLAAGASVSISNKLGELPLHLACLRGHVELARLLLAHCPAHVNVATKFQETPLHYAVRAKSPELVTLLLSYGADLSLQAIGGVTAMDRALESDDMGVVEALRQGHLKRQRKK